MQFYIEAPGEVNCLKPSPGENTPHMNIRIGDGNCLNPLQG